jgi:hypothetical protein
MFKIQFFSSLMGKDYLLQDLKENSEDTKKALETTEQESKTMHT